MQLPKKRMARTAVMPHEERRSERHLISQKVIETRSKKLMMHRN